MKISYIKIAIKFLFGGKEGVLDYLLDLANSAVAALSDANKEKAKAVVAFLDKLIPLMDKLLSWCPQKWRRQFLAVTMCLAAVANAAEDLQVTKEELAEIADKFRLAYAEWRVDDNAANLLGKLAEETETAQ